MLLCIMDFVNRSEELHRLDRMAKSAGGGLAVVYGRRRIGKTRLLLEWVRRHGGLYTVADQSAAQIQRRYFAQAIAARLPGFADAEYPDWRSLLARLARDAAAASWRGPLVLDELPYLVTVSPELPSVLQRWLDHEALGARLTVAVAGSSQRMMQGLVLSGSAPLYGRAREILDLGPIDPIYLPEAVPSASVRETVELYTAWGGVPRYWELAAEVEEARRPSRLASRVAAQVERLVLDPLGPLHREPDRLLLEELPSALEVRPVLDAIGAGAHRVSEIAARFGKPATSMARPLERLIEMGLVRRDVPFGESPKASRRGLYTIADPFFRLWFRVVAPHRGPLASATHAARLQLLAHFWDELAAQAWEDLCRLRLPRLGAAHPLGRLGPWTTPARWWSGAAPEWDLVCESLDGRRLLLGEAKWSRRPFGRKALDRARAELAAKPPPSHPAPRADQEVVRALFVPEVERGFAAAGRGLVTGEHLLRPPRARQPGTARGEVEMAPDFDETPEDFGDSV